MKFGFLGLGIMGSGIVKNLLNSGHKVIIWNRTAAKVGGTLFTRIVNSYNTMLQVFKITNCVTTLFMSMNFS